MLKDNGEFLRFGYGGYGESCKPNPGTNWTGEDGTYKPFHTFVPAWN